MKKLKRICASIVGLVLLITMVPLSVFANNDNGFAGGNGTKGNPYLIETAEQLDNVRNDLDAHYRLLNDIVLEESLLPIGYKMSYDESGSPFTGSFDGNGCTIKNLHIYIDDERKEAGLFAVNAGTIKNLNLEIVVGDEFYFELDTYYVGGIAAVNTGVISSCRVSGSIATDQSQWESLPDSTQNHKTSNSFVVGGVVGSNEGVVIGCSNDTDITIDFTYRFRADKQSRFTTVKGETNVRMYVGGISGWNSGEISRCSNEGSLNDAVSGATSIEWQGSKTPYLYMYSTLDSYIGGIVARNDGKVENSYNSEDIAVNLYASADSSKSSDVVVKCTNNAFVGGIAGANSSEIAMCYNKGELTKTEKSYDDTLRVSVATSTAYLGGICGTNNSPDLKMCYYSDSVPVAVAHGTSIVEIEPFDWSQSGNEDYFIGFDFESVWQNGLWWPTLQRYEELVEEHVHSYDAVSTEATCVDSGYTTYSCECGYSYVADEVPARGHEYSLGVCVDCGEDDPNYVVLTPKPTSAPVATDKCDGNFSLLKKGILASDNENVNGNKMLWDEDYHDGITDTYAIIYLPDTDQFMFMLRSDDGDDSSYIVMYLDEEGTDIVTVEYYSSSLGLEAAATFNVEVFNAEEGAYFELTAPFLLGESEIQEVCNLLLSSAFYSWERLLLDEFGLDLNMGDLGFVAWEKEISPSWEKNGHRFSNGVCIKCGAKEAITVTPKPTPTPTAKPTPTPTAKPTPTPTPTPITNPFTDVYKNDWYYESVLWAVDNGVTGGVSADKFGPNQGCTRAQVVTFIWAANGKPMPTTKDNPFADVKEYDWFYNAVLWAVENGITGGKTVNTFAPNEICTRAQIVTFLYAAESRPEINGINVFGDVDDTAWYTTPIIWAVENGVTSGIGDSKFGPNATCTRAQVATFLYKVMT